jgi:hypothetical protein
MRIWCIKIVINIAELSKRIHDNEKHWPTKQYETVYNVKLIRYQFWCTRNEKYLVQWHNFGMWKKPISYPFDSKRFRKIELAYRIHMYMTVWTVIQFTHELYRSQALVSVNKFWHLYTKENTRYSTLNDLVPMRIRVRIDPPHPLVCRERWLNGDPLGSGLE